MILKYTYEHIKDKDTQEKDFAIEDVEQGKASDYSYFMKQDGYKLISRTVASE